MKTYEKGKTGAQFKHADINASIDRILISLRAIFYLYRCAVGAKGGEGDEKICPSRRVLIMFHYICEP